MFERGHSEGFTTAGANLHHGELVRSKNGFANFRNQDVDVLLLQEINDPHHEYDPQIKLLNRRLREADYKLVHHFGDLAIAASLRKPIETIQKYSAPLQRMGRLAAAMSVQRNASRHELRFQRDVIGATLLMPDGQPATFISSHLTTAFHARERRNQEARFGHITKAIHNSATERHGRHAVIAELDANHFFNATKSMGRIARISGLHAVNFGNVATFDHTSQKRHAYLHVWHRPVQLDSAYHNNAVTPVDAQVIPQDDSDHYELWNRWSRV